MGNFLRAAVDFIHQGLVDLDPNLYTVDRIEEDLCRHPELAAQLCKAFELKFDPDTCDLEQHLEALEKLKADIEYLDTGHIENDIRRQNVLRQAVNFVEHTLKTNYYRLNYTSVSFRLDPRYLDKLPFDPQKSFRSSLTGSFSSKGCIFSAFTSASQTSPEGASAPFIPNSRSMLSRTKQYLYGVLFPGLYAAQEK